MDHPQEEMHMDSMDNVRERFAALEQQMEQLHQQTRTVKRRLRWWRGLACGLGLLGLVSLPLPSLTAQDKSKEKDLAQRVAALEQTLQYVTSGEKEVVITGANLRIVNGLENTDSANGLGNLIVGYNEERTFNPNDDNPPINIRTGSHNVVVGREHNFSRFGGIVVGTFNEILGDFASVTGGLFNTASDFASSVSGGQFNTASNVTSSVSGGISNTASGFASSVSGGGANTASGADSSVSGGVRNTASGLLASVSGGSERSAPEENNWAAGSLLEPN